MCIYLFPRLQFFPNTSRLFNCLFHWYSFLWLLLCITTSATRMTINATVGWPHKIQLAGRRLGTLHVLVLICRFAICLGDHSQKGKHHQKTHNTCGLKEKAKLILYKRHLFHEKKISHWLLALASNQPAIC